MGKQIISLGFIHLMTGSEGNSEFRFSKTLVIGAFCLLFYYNFKTHVIQGSYSFELLNSTTFHDLFRDLSEFPMTYVTYLLSKYCQNNLLINVCSHVVKHKMHASVYFVTGIKSGFLICLLVFNFWSFWLFILRKYITFPWLSMTHNSISWHYEII